MIVQGTTDDRVAQSGGPLAPIALLVEDEVLVAMIAEEFLTDLGFEPHTVSDSASALAAMAGGMRPVLAMIDVGLPDGRGDALALKLRGLYPDLRIIIASGYDAVDLGATVAGDSAITVLSKPYSEPDLVRAVQTLGLDASPI